MALKRNRNWYTSTARERGLSKERFYTLYYFALQYPAWKKRRAIVAGKDTAEESELRECMEIIEETCEETDPSLYPYLLRGVTEGITYQSLRSRYDMPCGVNRFGRIRTDFYCRLSEKIKIIKKF